MQILQSYDRACRGLRSCYASLRCSIQSSVLTNHVDVGAGTNSVTDVANNGLMGMNVSHVIVKMSSSLDKKNREVIVERESPIYLLIFSRRSGWSTVTRVCRLKPSVQENMLTFHSYEGNVTRMSSAFYL